MYPEPIQALITLFTRFPGIGPRQAARFVLFLVRQNREYLGELSRALADFSDRIGACSQCFRTIDLATAGEPRLCSFCRDPKRTPAVITVVERESDLTCMEKTGMIQGLYHVLGGVLSPLESESPKELHLRELFERVRILLENKQAVEIILATGATTEGDATARYIEQILQPLKEKFQNLKISRLARGLSLGAELEYADEVTLRNALTNRK